MRVLLPQIDAHPRVDDLSELVRPAKWGEKEAFRDYTTGNPLHERVKRTYKLMHTHQTAQFVKDKHGEWLNFDHFEATVMEALDLLNSFVDESDPDVDLPNIVHAFQTAERIKEVKTALKPTIFDDFLYRCIQTMTGFTWWD